MKSGPLSPPFRALLLAITGVAVEAGGAATGLVAVAIAGYALAWLGYRAAKHALADIRAGQLAESDRPIAVTAWLLGLGGTSLGAVCVLLALVRGGFVPI